MTLSHPLVRAFIEVLRYLGVLLPGFIALFLIVRAFVDGNVSDMTYALWLLVIFAATLLIKVQPFENRQAARWPASR